MEKTVGQTAKLGWISDVLTEPSALKVARALGFYRLIDFNTWSLVGETLWEG